MNLCRTLVLAAALIVGISGRAEGEPNPLEKYVLHPDATYNWKRTEHKAADHATVYHLELVSQTWRGQFWSHHLLVLRPQTVRNPKIAFLYITGDGSGDKELKMLNVLAERAGAVCVVV